ncbi:MAG: three-Cys-motif partner protein TcmP [Archangium sp.]|nr:three-Cys-motif partner protein TcmP [Archangium sp.]
MIDFACYVGREQTGVKHFILSEYLQRFGMIIGKWASAITYVDCFSGPWKQTSEQLQDTSFFIALQELRKARDVVQQTFGRQLKLRAFFVEKEAEPYAQLRAFGEREGADVEIQTRNSPLEDCIADIVSFVRAGGHKNFPFIFIDPTGWTGFGLNAIEPMLKLKPAEVLINFMTQHVRRLVEHPEEGQRGTFEALYGAERANRVLARIKGKVEMDREDILVEEYMAAVAETGGFDHTSAAIVLNPKMDRTHFHLVYGTRNLKGLEVFKGAEQRAMEAMQEARADARARHADRRTGQSAFEFRNDVPRHDEHYQQLRHRYTESSRARFLALVRSRRRVEYEAAYSAALTRPLTFPTDLRGWVADLRNTGAIGVEGLTGSERVPKLGEGHFLTWLCATTRDQLTTIVETRPGTGRTEGSSPGSPGGARAPEDLIADLQKEVELHYGQDAVFELVFARNSDADAQHQVNVIANGRIVECSGLCASEEEAVRDTIFLMRSVAAKLLAPEVF